MSTRPGALLTVLVVAVAAPSARRVLPATGAA